MRLIFFVIFIFYSACFFSQTVIKTTVKDSQTKEPLGFCNVSIKGIKKGTITNADGVFKLSVDTSKNILVFSYIGYNTLSIRANKLIQKPEILLVKNDIALQEITIHSDNDYLYNIMLKCRKKLLSNKSKNVARIYYGVETNSKTLSVEYPDKTGMMQKYLISKPEEKPVELLECFYNGYVTGATINKLQFKNGRTALAAADNYFLTHNTSKAISKIVLTNENDYFPQIPFQYGKNNMRKIFQVELQYSDNNSYCIRFFPFDNRKDCFSGEVWIEKRTFNLLKIHLMVKDASKYPFVPIIPSLDSINDVSLDITNTYKNDDGILPDHFYFNYSFTYHSRRDSIIGILPKLQKNVTRKINSKCIMYFYDYNHPFILPYFEYNNDFNDYLKMSFIPYNQIFWDNNNILLQTEKQKESFGVLSNEGQLINYREKNYGNNFLGALTQFVPQDDSIGIFEFFYAFWSSKKRIVPYDASNKFEPYSQLKINQSIKNDLYNLKVQILLDITESGDSLICKSYTVFDNYQSYYHLQRNFYTNAFLNIYFDICEIERRKMQKTFNSKNFIMSQIDSIYKATNKNMDIITKHYLKEVDVGEQLEFLRKWNQYVLKNLNIDNIKMVENTSKHKNPEINPK